MTKQNFSLILSLSSPEQALDLPRRELLAPELKDFTPRDLYEAAEYLLAIDNCDNLYSQIAVVTRAYRLGWVSSKQLDLIPSPSQPIDQRNIICSKKRKRMKLDYIILPILGLVVIFLLGTPFFPFLLYSQKDWQVIKNLFTKTHLPSVAQTLSLLAAPIMSLLICLFLLVSSAYLYDFVSTGNTKFPSPTVKEKLFLVWTLLLLVCFSALVGIAVGLIF